MIKVYYGLDSGFVQHKARGDLRKSLPEDAFSSLIKYDGYKDLVGDFLSDCLSLSLFGGKKTIVVVNAYYFLNQSGKKNPIPDSSQDYKGLREYRKSPSNETDLIRIVPGMVDKRGTLYKAARESSVELVSCLSPSDNDLSLFAKERASGQNKKIDQDAINLLLSYFPGDFLSFENALDKLLCYSSHVRKSDVLLLVAPPLEKDVFSIVTSLLRKDTKRALGVYQDLRKGGSLPLSLFPVFVSQFRFMALVKALAEQGEGQDSIAKELGVKPGRIYYARKDRGARSYSTLLSILSDRADREKDRKLNRDDGDVRRELFLATFVRKYRY